MGGSTVHTYTCYPDLTISILHSSIITDAQCQRAYIHVPCIHVQSCMYIYIHVHTFKHSDTTIMQSIQKIHMVHRLSTCRAKHLKCEERHRRKNQYEEGMWNVNTVLMGGLGGDPDSSDSSSEEGIILDM